MKFLKNKNPGSISEMISIALPMIVSNACETIMIFTDRLFLSRLNPHSMNAAMGGGLTIFMSVSFFMGIVGYSTAIVAQFFGAKQKYNCSKVISQALILGLLSYPIIILLRPLGIMLFNNAGINQQQLEYQIIYFNILIYGSIFSLIRIALSSFFSGIGVTSVVMKASLTSMIVNVLSNYVLIYGHFGFPKLGISGAAYGTIIGSISGIIVLFLYYLNKFNRKTYNTSVTLHLNKAIMMKLLRFGYPAGLELFLNILAFNLIVLIFHSCGIITATASTIVFNWDMVSFVPLIGIEIAITSLVGRYMGAQKTHIAERAVSSGIKIGLIYSSVLLFVFAFFPNALVKLFKPFEASDIFEKAMPLAVFMVRLVSLYVFVEVLFIAFAGALRGAGDSFWAMVLSVSLHWILVPIMYVLLKVFGFSPKVGWITFIFIFLIFSYFVFLRYKKGHWKKINMIYSEANALAVIHDDFHEKADL